MSDKVSKEVAEQEFERFIELADGDLEDMNAEEKDSFADHKRRITRAIRNGWLVIDEDGLPRMTPRYGNTNELVFRRMTGATLVSGAKNEVTKMFDMMAQLTETDRSRFQKMDYRDLSVCMAIANIFLA